MSLLFVFFFALKGVLYPSKDINLTQKHGDVKTTARKFFGQNNFDARGKDTNKERKQSCRQLAEMFNIGKTAPANIIKNEGSIRKEYEDLKRKRKGQFNDINEILYEWFKKCCAENIYPDGPIFKEEAMEIKKRLDKVEFKNFTASNGWLEKWKISYGVRESKVNGEAGEVAEYTVSLWIERLVELTRGNKPADIWNMDETDCFLGHCQRKVLVKRKVKPEEGKSQNRG